MHIAILKRAGAVLLTVGLLDIGLMIYCLANKISYSSNLNIFAVIAGIFLMRGSLRAASIVRWLALFLLCASAGMLIAWPMLQPIGLTLTQLRLASGAIAQSALLVVLMAALLAWLVRTLGQPAVMEARAQAGRKRRSTRLPAALGFGMVAILVVVLVTAGRSASADRARDLATREVGANYRLHVASLNMRSGSAGTSYGALVVAWNENEIRNIPVSWQEP
ncbi:MAG: hypothetical protein V4723_02475 [Pseudomonadota bacterium]